MERKKKSVNARSGWEEIGPMIRDIVVDNELVVVLLEEDSDQRARTTGTLKMAVSLSILGRTSMCKYQIEQLPRDSPET